MLPGFGPENWTSEIRDTFGFQSFEGKSFADFRYEDNKGTLTGILFGEQKKIRMAYIPSRGQNHIRDRARGILYEQIAVHAREYSTWSVFDRLNLGRTFYTC
jgi:hypothetical protein